MQLLELMKTVHFASTLFRDSIKHLYITLTNTFYKYQLYVDILFMQHSRTKRRKWARAKKSGHWDDGDADRRGQGTIIKNRQGKSPSKTCSKATAEWVGHLCRNLSGVQDSKVWLKTEPNTSSVFETATYTVFFLSTSSPFWSAAKSWIHPQANNKILPTWLKQLLLLVK